MAKISSSRASEESKPYVPPLLPSVPLVLPPTMRSSSLLAAAFTASRNEMVRACRSEISKRHVLRTYSRVTPITAPTLADGGASTLALHVVSGRKGHMRCRLPPELPPM